jgi:parallel beta-helix repeat protein
MKLRTIFISLSCLLLIYSCRENNELSNNIIDPTLGGVYTEIEGNISGTLAFTDSPFLVVGDIFVSANDTLKVDAGVTITFKRNKMLTAEGIILAEGTKQRPISFTSFISNQTTWLGISLLNPTGTSVFEFCIIQDVWQQTNDPLTNGAIEISSTNVIVKQCVFRNNGARYGGGLAVFNSNVIIENNIFRNNDAEIYGGAMYIQNSSAVIINNTIYKNTCFNFGGGIVLRDPLNTEIQNNIFFDNLSFTSDNRIAIVSGDSSNVIEQYNYLAFGSMNPMFISNDNLHLSSGSPCINKGNPAPEYNDVDGSRNDQGAFGGPLGDW